MTWGKKTVTVSIRLDEETVEGLKALAEADDRKLSPYIARLLKRHLEENRQALEKPSKGGRSR